MVQLLIAGVIAVTAAGGGWWLDEELTRSRGMLRAIFAVTLLAATAGLCAVILAEPWLWDAEVREEAFWMFRMRVLAAFVVLGSLVVSSSLVLVTVTALIMPRPVSRWRLCVVPALALVLFALALHLVGKYHFMPSA
jgi:hypothetical protein